MMTFPLLQNHLSLTAPYIHPSISQYFLNLRLKLTTNLRKSQYVVHSRNLKLYVQLGLVITKGHCVLTSPWLKTYIDFNTCQQSLLAGDNFLKDFLVNEQQHFWEDARKFEQLFYVSELQNQVSVKVFLSLTV